MRLRIIATIAIVVFAFAGCGPVQYHTLYEGMKDPLFDLDTSQTVGLIPTYWTQESKELGIDELMEKQLLAYCKTELEKRGFKVMFIPKANLKEVDGKEVHCHGLDEYPDLTLTVGYIQRQGTVNIPAQSFGSFSFNEYGGSGWSGAHGSYNVNVWDLYIFPILWSEPPEYMRQVWRGTILQGSPRPDLSERAETMIRKLFNKKFPQDLFSTR